MDWFGWLLVAGVVIGLAAGTTLAVRSYLTNPATLTSLVHFLVKLLLPRVLAYVFGRKSEAEEAADRQKRRQGEELNRPDHR